MLDAYHAAMEAFAPREALEAVWALLSDLNKFLVEREPWKKTGTQDALDALSEAARALRLCALCVEPATPLAGPAIARALGFDPTDFINFRWEDRQHAAGPQAHGVVPPGGQGGVLRKRSSPRTHEPTGPRREKE